MLPEPTIDEDDAYASSEDSDFTLDDVQQAASDHSDSEAENVGKHDKRQRPAGDANTEEEDYNNSGDEAIIKRGRKKQKKSMDKTANADDDDDDEGGEGGLIKTRRQRAAEKEVRKTATSHGPVTVDVDALWAQMMSGETTEANQRDTDKSEDERPRTQNGDSKPSNADAEQDTQPTLSDDLSAMIKIKRTYNFAGRVHTEEKLVARDSAEAKLYLASQGEEAPADDLPSKRITKRAFRSAFEPIVDGAPGRTDLNLGMSARIQAAKEAHAKKLNTVEKSRMDWAGYVDKEGLQDELQLAGKSKDSYATRQDFLARSEALRNEDARKARMSGRL